jgi:PAS domain S-box-containing protein
MAALLRTGVLRNAEYELARKDGGFLHVELSAVSFMGPQGQPQGFVLVARDITDRKRAEGQIRLLANAFTCAHEMVYITDGQLGIRLVNRAALEAYGYPEEELLGRRADFLHSANNPPGLWERISQKIMQSGWKGELLCRRKDGSEFLAELNTSQMKDSEGRVDGLVCVVRDISEQKRAEKQRIAFAELGQRLNAAATAEQTAEIILEIASELFACDAGCVVLYSQTEDKIIPVLAVNTVDGRRMSVPLSTLSHEPTPLMRLVMQEGPRLTNRGDQLPAGVELLQFGGVASRPACQMDVPIRVNGVVQGLLSIQSCTPGAYSPDDLKLLEILAAHSARTLKRLKVTAALRKRRPGIAISSRTRPKGSSRRHSKAVCSTPIWRWLAFWVMNRPRR